ncbi:MAG TPA: IPT/TIG domain-containing protein, partial [Bacteroidia bacterium]|nr:IPT/TIG domain-containing protein [Bacteroidia bacterium]
LEWYNQDFSTDLGSGLSITGLSAGDYNYVVVDDNGCSPVLGPFTVSVIDAPAIVVGTITPSTGAVGSTVTLSGSGFTGATGVSFNGTSATVFSVVDDNTITVTVPTGATDGPITVSVGGCTGVSGGSFTVQNDATFNLKAYMQGYYIGSGAMNSVLMNQGISVDANEMDTVTVQLRDQFDPTVVVATSVAVMNVNGEASFTIPGTVIGGNYYIAVFHRNTVQTWSALPVTFAATTSYDFTTSASQAFGDNQVEVEPGVFAMYTGDLNQDENVDIADQPILETDISNFEFGYFVTDTNGDGNVDIADSPIMETNVGMFIYSAHP